MDPSLTSTDYNPDRLIAGDFPRVTRDVTIASSVALTRGAVLGKVTADGKFKLSASAAADGSETATAILAKDADASGGDVTGSVFLTGEFNESELTFGTGHDADSVRDDLRAVSIFLKDSVAP